MVPRRSLLLAAPAALLTGCATAPQGAALAQAWPAGRPRRVELDAVPFFPQTELDCGPAALATVLAHTGAATTPDALREQVFLPAREGTLQVEMLAGARRHGRVPVRLPPQLDALCAEVAAGHPVVLLQNLALPLWPRWHYAVAVGYDAEARTVLLRSGTRRRLTVDWTPLERTWARSGYWAFTALPPGELPPTADEGAMVEALLAFERVARPADAATAYAAARARWPDSLTLAMGEGNSRYAAGDAAGAARCFEAAATAHDSAAAWHNLAQVQLEQGQLAQARASAQRALARARTAEPRWRPAAESLAGRLALP